MSGIAWWLAFSVPAACLLWAVVRFLLPFRELLLSLRRIASGDFRAVILRSVPFPFRGVADDLRKTAETLASQKALLEAEEFSLSLILQSMGEGVVITGADLRIRQLNKAAEALSRLPAGVAGSRLSEAFSNHELESLAVRSLSSRTPQRGELDIRIAGGGSRHLVVTAAVLGSSPEKPDGVLLVLHDVTRLRELEAVRREFVANVSHEFRTPLSVISGYLETLEEDGEVDAETTLRAYAAMRRHTDRLKLLIEDLLTVSHMEEKGVLLETRSTPVGPLLKEMVEQADQEIAARGAEVTLTLRQDLPPVVLDPYRIQQAFSNLLANALRHGSSGGGGHLEITAELAGDEVAVGFRDDGPGIPLADQPHLFERFYRVGGHRARDSGGTGLGLSIVKNIVQAHGGRVTLESSPGHGALFTVWLPVNR
jgi:two-component system phosphate regulon sensor histidine kinase PhoR